MILLSTRDGEPSDGDGSSDLADDHLVEPFSARELLARVDRHLELARASRTGGPAPVHDLDESDEWYQPLVGERDRTAEALSISEPRTATPRSTCNGRKAVDPPSRCRQSTDSASR